MIGLWFFTRQEQVVQSSKLYLVLVFGSYTEGAKHVECIVDSALHVFEVKFETTRLHYLGRYVCACCHLVQLNLLQYSV